MYLAIIIHALKGFCGLGELSGWDSILCHAIKRNKTFLVYVIICSDNFVDRISYIGAKDTPNSMK